MDLHATLHAVERFQQRVENVTDAEARRRLSSPTIRKAAEIGCTAVKLPGGQRVIIENNTVITVHPRMRIKRRRYGRREREE